MLIGIILIGAFKLMPSVEDWNYAWHTVNVKWFKVIDLKRSPDFMPIFSNPSSSNRAESNFVTNEQSFKSLIGQ